MSTLRAGLSRQKISPPLGIYLMGYGNRIQGDIGIHDNLYTTTLVLDDGDTRAALSTCQCQALIKRVVMRSKQRCYSRDCRLVSLRAAQKLWLMNSKRFSVPIIGRDV
jgi:hypothetical protein